MLKIWHGLVPLGHRLHQTSLLRD
jgi:hypothetical protein